METITLAEELEFHQTVLRLVPGLIENARAEIEFWNLFFKINPEGNAQFIDLFLDARNEIERKIIFFSSEFKISEDWFEARGIDPFPLTKEEKKAFAKEYPDPYRWRVPLWIKEPIQKLFAGNKNPAQ